MTTISHKYLKTLIEKFLRKPNEFESYIKGQLNALEKINLLKKTQFDKSIDDYTYFKNFFNSVSFKFDFVELYEEYKNELSKRLPKENIINVKTNIFYVDGIRSFYEVMDNFLEKNKVLRAQTYFSRMICSLYINENQFKKENEYKLKEMTELSNIDKIYNIDEIINICRNNRGILIDNYVESENISINEIVNGINSKTLVLNRAILNDLDFNNKLFADYNACRNELDRKCWYLLYGTFFHYIRINKISFDNSNEENVINLSNDFNEIVNHITGIITEIKTKYKKNHKELPDKYKKVISYALDKINIEKDKYFISQDSNNDILKNIIVKLKI